MGEKKGSDIVEKEFDNEIEAKIFDLNIRAQELEIKIDKLEEQAMTDDEILTSDEYLEYKAEYKKINKERKQLKKELNSQDKSNLNQISIWIIIYGILMVIISFPIITGTLWLDFANSVIDLVAESVSGLHKGDFIYDVVIFLVIFSFPLLMNLITWLLYNNFVNSKVDKKVYISFWIAQGVLTLIMVIYMSTQLFGA